MTAAWTLVATLLRYTIPQWAAYGCVEAPLVPAQVESVKVYGWPIASTQVRLLRAKDVRGRDGQPDSVWVDVAGPWTIYAVGVRLGREGCAGNLVAVGRWPLGVPVGAAVRDTGWYDVQGRHIQGPAQRGVRAWRPR